MTSSQPNQDRNKSLQQGEASRKLIEEMFKRNESSPPVMPESAVHYRGIPDPQRQIWIRSDDELQTNYDWEILLTQTKAKLLDAAALCVELAAPSGRMTKHKRNQYISTLTTAFHELNELLYEMHWHYPLPYDNWYSLASANPDLLPRMPSLLTNTADLILIYLPGLPPVHDGGTNIIFQEFVDFLRLHELAYFPKWHCDFIHVYSKNSHVYDADNYNFKPVIDALALTLGSRDCTDCFSYSNYNLPSETIAAGSYIRITKRAEKVGFFRDFEEFVSALQQSKNE